MKAKTIRYLTKFLYFLDVKKCRRLKISPKSILFPVIWITNRCNLRCKMCDQWKTDPKIISKELTTKEWYSFVDSAYRMHVAVIVITGGEPFLREDIFDILRYIYKKGIACHVCTNGSLLDENTIDKLRDLKLDSISISLDSDREEIHNEMRGIDCFDKVVKGIKLLRHSIQEIKIGINCVITKRNFHDLYRIVPFVENLGVHQIKFDPIHTNLMHRRKNPYSFGNLFFTKEDIPELRHEINKLIYAVSRTKLLTTSSIFIKEIPNLYRNHSNKLPCYAGYISCAVDALGWVSPCDNFDGEENLRDKSLEEIWKSSSFQRLRQNVYNCNSCCWDTTHAELNIRCSAREFFKEFGQILKETNFYFIKNKTSKLKN